MTGVRLSLRSTQTDGFDKALRDVNRKSLSPPRTVPALNNLA